MIMEIPIFVWVCKYVIWCDILHDVILFTFDGGFPGPLWFIIASFPVANQDDYKVAVTLMNSDSCVIHIIIGFIDLWSRTGGWIIGLSLLSMALIFFILYCNLFFPNNWYPTYFGGPWETCSGWHLPATASFSSFTKKLFQINVLLIFQKSMSS